MNIAFQALLIFLVIFPGFFFTQAYYKIENFSIKFVPLSNITTMAIIVSLLLHVLCITILITAGCAIDPKKFINLVISTTHETNGELVLRTREIFGAVIYFVNVAIIAFFIGYGTRSIINYYKLDKKITWLRIDNYWYYFFKAYDFQEEEADIVEIIAAVQINNETLLYKGILREFILDSKGKLDQLVISDAKRRDINLNNFETIPGHFFLLKYSEILNMNIYFFSLSEVNKKKK